MISCRFPGFWRAPKKSPAEKEIGFWGGSCFQPSFLSWEVDCRRKWIIMMIHLLPASPCPLISMCTDTYPKLSFLMNKLHFDNLIMHTRPRFTCSLPIALSFGITHQHKTCFISYRNYLTCLRMNGGDLWCEDIGNFQGFCLVLTWTRECHFPPWSLNLWFFFWETPP